MTSVSRLFVKTAFVFLIFGLLLGGGMLLRRELYGVWPSPYLVSAHTHIMFVGFVMFMILGVALWLFPKPARNDTRYRESLVRLVYGLLLTGTVLRLSGELGRGLDGPAFLAWVVLAGGLGQLGAIILYVWTMWYRIRSTTDYKKNRVSRVSPPR